MFLRRSARFAAALLGVVLLVTAVRAFPPSATGPANGSIRVAGIVLKWLRGEKELNFQRAEAMIRQAAAGGASVVCTTECFLDGYAIKDKTIPLDVYRELGEPIPAGPYFRRLARLADELDIYLVAGMLERDGERLYNTAVLIDPRGELAGKYHKQELGHESVRNSAGHESTVFTTEHGKVGLMICADRTVPQIVRRFAEGGAELLICPSGGMFGPRTNDPIVQARSRETGLPIVFVHPAEFLVTGSEGQILKCELLGEQLEIDKSGIGGPADSKSIFFYDWPLSR
jgi:predicted amidohydrolase